MSYENPKIKYNDSVMSIVIKMAEGNIGAVNVLSELVKQGPAIDPDDIFKGVGAIMQMDNLDLYGSNIWLLYKDICGEDLTKTIGVLRAVQLGFIPGEDVKSAVDASRSGTPKTIDVNGLLQKVKDRLENFGRQPETV